MIARAPLVAAIVFAAACHTNDVTQTASSTDGGAVDATTPDAVAFDASSTTVTASDYDQTCTSRSDCVGIEEGSVCGCGALNAAINVRDLAKEQADAEERRARCAPQRGTCGAATATTPVCVKGRCGLFDCRTDLCPDAGGDGGDCTNDLDCGAHMLCVGGRCEVACASQSECGSGVCNVGSGVCFGPPGCNAPAPYPEAGCATVCYGYCREVGGAATDGGASD